ncbi:MAG TPA: putative toxin-antitoxin system toxin component, PIN family [Burkholderiaceae bacterium]|nr:putative toxin-antitoxin system toxin component, PIN family [Burkholderiaceae bacterium]
MRAVVDTNVWLDLLVFDDPRIAPLAGALGSGALVVLATAPMLEEFADVIGRPRFAIDAARREALVARQRAAVRLVEPAPDCRLACTDRDDQRFVDLAVAHRTDWLLSRDKALLRLRRTALRRFGLRIGTPEAWSAEAAPGGAPTPRL